MAYIETHVPENFRQNVRLILPHFLVAMVLDLPSNMARREYLMDIPLNANPDWCRAFVRMQAANDYRPGVHGV